LGEREREREREREIVNVQGREERRMKRRNELGRDAWK
jgi:hypothetical protein